MKDVCFLIAALTFTTSIAYSAYSSENPKKNHALVNPQVGPLGQYVTDSKINLSVRSKLLCDKKLMHSNILVATHHGIVKLTGNVSSAIEKKRAANLAFKINGVRSVKNNLEIQSFHN